MAKAPLFQARHYRFLADVLHSWNADANVIQQFSDALKSDNSNFNRERFEYAATHGVNKNTRQTRAPKRPSSLGRATALAGSTYGSFINTGQKGGHND